MSKLLKKIAIAATIAGSAFVANATPVVGLANLTLGAVVVSLGELDFNPSLDPGVNATPTYGSFALQSLTSTGSFNIPGNTLGTIQDMSQNPGDANYVPLGAINVPSFLNFAAQPNWQFTATYLAPGQTFGLFASPYILTQLGGNVSATVSLAGTVCDAGVDALCDLTDDVTDWTLILSAQYTNTTIANIVNTLVAGGSLSNNTWSGTLEASAVPEPESLALMGIGLIGLAVARRRRAVK